MLLEFMLTLNRNNCHKNIFHLYTKLNYTNKILQNTCNSDQRVNNDKRHQAQ